YNDKLTVSQYDDGDDDELWIVLGNSFRASDQLKGAVYISNLMFWADEDAPMPAAGKSIDIKMNVDGEDNITEEEILVAQRVDWAVSLKTTNTVPTLVSGRYIGPSWSGIDADDNTHKTAHVQMYESTSNAWWSSRTTVLALPATDNSTVKGAKFRKVEITDISNLGDYAADLEAKHSSTMYGLDGNAIGGGVYLNDGERHGFVTVNDNKITLNNIRVNQNKKATIDFDLWVSVELGFGKQTGDLKLSIDPSSTSLTGDQEAYSSVVIAHIVDPITVTTKVSDLKIGYQYQPTADIQITENGGGYLLKNKTVRISITDLINSDMWFTSDTKIQVTSGDMKIKNITTSGIGGFTSQSSSWLSSSTDTASIAFDIERESTAASTVTISNVAVKLDRTVPVTNKQSYQAIVWGTAVAENYGLTGPRPSETGAISSVKVNWKAGFNTAGVYSPYINVISSPDDQGSILSQEVRVTIGENYYTVNGVSYTMPAAAYISAASHSTLVPLRFVANAFGLRDENQIVWDDTNKTATIFAPNRTVQFTLNKSTMIVDGVSITMFSPDNLPVMAEIKGDRMYIPFRALGQAFGVPVTWDAATQTAIYNEGANTNTNAAVTNTSPTDDATPVPTVSVTPTVTP
ncbi:MAG: copper amine oxidase N-terminal domain-containing protein, partial [Clostridiales bacterium]|nr:copper amine oxidase N-terminal domain-containing protein [Clostridiales bacterium]